MTPFSGDWPGLIERDARIPGDWPEGIVAVFVHGAMDRGAGMAHLARQLRDAPTLRYDRRGYGRAAVLGVGDLIRHVDDLIALVGSRRAVLFGHSFGGLVVLGAAATGRLDVRGLVTWEVPTPWIEGWTHWSVPDPGDDVEDRPGAIADAFMVATIGRDRFDRLPASTRAARRREGPALIADMDTRLSAGPPFEPSRIVARCIFGAGVRARAPYASGAGWLASRVPDGRAELVEGATHGAPTADARMVAGLLREVVAENRSAIESSEVRDAVSR